MRKGPTAPITPTAPTTPKAPRTISDDSRSGVPIIGGDGRVSMMVRELGNDGSVKAHIGPQSYASDAACLLHQAIRPLESACRNLSRGPRPDGADAPSGSRTSFCNEIFRATNYLQKAMARLGEATGSYNTPKFSPIMTAFEFFYDAISAELGVLENLLEDASKRLSREEFVSRGPETRQLLEDVMGWRLSSLIEGLDVIKEGVWGYGNVFGMVDEGKSGLVKWNLLFPLVKMDLPEMGQFPYVPQDWDDAWPEYLTVLCAVYRAFREACNCTAITIFPGKDHILVGVTGDRVELGDPDAPAGLWLGLRKISRLRLRELGDPGDGGSEARFGDGVERCFTWHIK